MEREAKARLGGWSFRSAVWATARQGEGRQEAWGGAGYREGAGQGPAGRRGLGPARGREASPLEPPRGCRLPGAFLGRGGRALVERWGGPGRRARPRRALVEGGASPRPRPRPEPAPRKPTGTRDGPGANKPVS